MCGEQRLRRHQQRHCNRRQLADADRHTLASLKQVNEPDVPMLSVALQEVRNLVQASGWNSAELDGLFPT